MRSHSTVPMQDFIVDVAFSSGEQQFAIETYEVRATTWFKARQEALQMSVNSVYDNPRIPDLKRQAIIRSA